MSNPKVGDLVTVCIWRGVYRVVAMPLRGRADAAVLRIYDADGTDSLTEIEQYVDPECLEPAADTVPKLIAEAKAVVARWEAVLALVTEAK